MTNKPLKLTRTDFETYHEALAKRPEATSSVGPS